MQLFPDGGGRDPSPGTSRRRPVTGLLFQVVRSPAYNARESPPKEPPPMHDRIAYQGITFDDVLLEPAYSDVVPREVDVRTRLTRNIRLNIPIISSPMDTVTESDLAIALAQEGGIGIIHKNMPVPQQTREVD